MTTLPRQHCHLARSPAETGPLIAELQDLLLSGSSAPYDGWLAARGNGMLRERDGLLARLVALRGRQQHRAAVDGELERLVIDVEHHLQRRRDLAWDEVELELGGSE